MKLRWLLLLVVFTLAGITLASAKAKAKPHAAPDDRVLVKSVDVAGNAITLTFQKDKTEKTYTVNDGTQITVLGEPGKLADIKEGMQVDNFTDANLLLSQISVIQAKSPPTH